MSFEEKFAEIGAFWLHDGNPRRPYARLTSGLVSDGFFNCGMVVSERPQLFAETLQHLVNIADLPDSSESFMRIVGAAKGAIVLPFLIARYSDQAFAYAEKAGDDLLFEERFTQYFDQEIFQLCEDTVTTGGTLRKLEKAIRNARPGALISDHVLAICNRSGFSTIDGRRVIALVDRPMQTWEEGKNPFTPDGRELVPPVRPKTHWEDLTRQY